MHVLETAAQTLIFLYCDCVSAEGWLDVALSRSGCIDIVGGEVFVFDETPDPRSGAEAFETAFAFRNQQYVEAMAFSVTAN